jgi:hypothetical protein
MADAAARLERQISELFDSRNNHEGRIIRLETWKNNNGHGAERRIEELEETADTLDREAVRAIACEKHRNELEARITKAVEEAIKKAARRPLVRDWGPVLIGLLAAASPVIVSLISKGGTP